MTFFKDRKFTAIVAALGLSILVLIFGPNFKKGIDIAGGVQLQYYVDFSKYEQVYTDSNLRQQAINDAMNIIQANIGKRVNSLGLGDSEIKREVLNGRNYITAKIGGFSDIEQAKAVIGKTVELEFKVPNTLSAQEQKTERKYIATQLLDASKQVGGSIQAVGTGKTSDDIYYSVSFTTGGANLPTPVAAKWSEIKAKEGVYASVIEGSAGTGSDASGNNIAINGFFVVNNAQKQVLATGDLSGQTIYAIETIFVRDTAQWVAARDPKGNGEVLNGAYFRYASVGVGQTGLPVVSIQLDSKGKDIFCNLSEAMVGKQIAIFVGGNLLTAPSIREKICGGQAQIDGGFTAETAKQLSNDLNEGALPAALILSDQQSVEPTLGANAWNGSLYAMAISLVLIFLLLWYMYDVTKAILGAAGVLLYLIVLVAVYKLFGYALSLSNIAAIILNIGMGVDSSILIFERLKEELVNKKFDLALNEAYHRSWAPILDGNISSGLIGLIMAMIGSDIFQGFGIAMVLSTIILLCVSVPATYYLLALFSKKSS